MTEKKCMLVQCNSRNLNPMLCMKWVELHGDRVGYDDTTMLKKGFENDEICDHRVFPIVTFVDTPVVFADLRSEEIGQGEPIAPNLRAMFELRVPIITIVTNEGGSGKTLVIGCANKWLILENPAFYVASPEACATILWKSSQATPKAAEKLRN
ncbi:hypothetical protein KY290_033755 [Solanum tuberosum]|uniref:acetyl-CoA carboxytransferase n=1 Tax=Solanum tuberosum TaxID=4113 RepID=A0ABQ7U194_SOLTU|nr:hypothetical protein KY289_033128 [Solanum tuberosum]KAH0644825.1 hypothetical protein KY284_032709 [Solanum tuberosum]KAH0647769.1 hypothetical protein KY285_033017 [Solanum tuberosum]KAH0740712.1 hypothetical protein KY290_033755 [Solanum tuberosum]